MFIISQNQAIVSIGRKEKIIIGRIPPRTKLCQQCLAIRHAYRASTHIDQSQQEFSSREHICLFFFLFFFMRKPGSCLAAGGESPFAESSPSSSYQRIRAGSTVPK